MANKIALGRQVVKHSPAVLSSIAAPKMLGVTGTVKVPKVRTPRSVPTQSRTKFRPSATQLPTEKIGSAVRG